MSITKDTITIDIVVHPDPYAVNGYQIYAEKSYTPDTPPESNGESIFLKRVVIGYTINKETLIPELCELVTNKALVARAEVDKRKDTLISKLTSLVHLTEV